MRSALVSVAAFALALLPLFAGTLPMTWPLLVPTSTPMLQPARQSAGEAVERGKASLIANVLEGRKTANGERYDADALTAAHRTLPFDTRVVVTHVETGRTVIVRINDRGPWADARIIDLSRRAGEALGIDAKQGIAEITLRVVGRPSDST